MTFFAIVGVGKVAGISGAHIAVAIHQFLALNLRSGQVAVFTIPSIIAPVAVGVVNANLMWMRRFGLELAELIKKRTVGIVLYRRGFPCVREPFFCGVYGKARRT